MTQTHDTRRDVHQGFRRYHDGSIDFDFYRAQATALRNRAMQEAFRHAGAQLRTPFKRWWMRLVLLPGGR